MARKPVDNESDPLWEKVTKTVTPLEKRRRLLAAPVQKQVKKPAKKKADTPQSPVLKKSPARKKSQPQNQTQNQPPEMKPADLSQPGYGGISRSDARRIKKGQSRPTARLDLHGSTRAEAQSKLEKFLVNARDEGHRVVLIITGKGADGKGVIRSNLPGWLESPLLSSLVIAHSPARQKDGGNGAFYVNLRQS